MKSLKVITGAAGTGKTEEIRSITQDLYNNNSPCIVVAPTNKAAKVLRSRGINAKTIHSALYHTVKTGQVKQIYRAVIDLKTGKPELDKSGQIKYSIETEPVFEYKFKSDLHSDFTIIIDEASMVNSKIWKDIYTHFKGNLIVVGDPQQLLPVESDDDDEVFSEYEQHFNKLSAFADVNLGDNSSNRRLKNDTSGIMMAINHISNVKNTKGEFPSLWGHEDFGYTYLNIKSTHTLDSDIQNLLPEVDAIICWRNSECDFINQFVRQKKYKEKFQKLPMIGDKLYAENRFTKVKNIDHDRQELIPIITKGDELIIEDISELDKENNVLFVKFLDIDDWIPISTAKILGGSVKKNFQHLRWSYAYAITCHKAQGSGWDTVVILDSYNYPKDAKRWRYTAATRAKENLFVIASNEPFDKVRLS